MEVYMKIKQFLWQTTLFVTPLVLIFGAAAVFGDGNQPETPQSVECVEVIGYAQLGEDLDCKIANNHHRNEQYPESIFFYDLMPETCSDPDNGMEVICCVKGKMWGTIGDYDFIAGAACGFTVNDFAVSELGIEAADELAGMGYQQFTARTLLRVFLDTTELPEPRPGGKEVKADFGLFLGDSGISRDDMFVSQRMILTGARKLPRGAKMKLDMVGLPPVREISGTLCAPKLVELLDIIAQKGPGAQDHDDDEDDDDGDEDLED
jgi:hypothetical protein